MIPTACPTELSHKPFRAVVQGLVIRDHEKIRVMIEPVEGLDPAQVEDVVCWRQGQALCVGSAPWPDFYRIENIQPQDWEALDRGQGQCWFVSPEGDVLDVFALTV